MISPTLLALITITSPTPAPALAQGPEWIGADLFRHHMLFLPVSVNGIETQALLDSGAGMTCVSSAMAAKLGLEDGMPVIAQGVAGSMPAVIFSGVDLTVGRARLEGARVVAIDFEDVEVQLGHKLPVVLGRDFFDKYVVDIDYPNARVAFRDPEGYTYEGPGSATPLHATSGGLFAIDVSVEGKEPARFMIDTGSNRTLSIESAYAGEQQLLEGRERVSTAIEAGAGGGHEVRIATLRELSLAGTSLRDVPVNFSPEQGKPILRAGSVGNIGGAVLSRFRVIFDAQRERLILEPDEQALAKPFRRDRFGVLVLLTEEGLSVEHICPGSPAASSGLKKGMRILAIDGAEVGPGYWRELDGWQNRAAGTKVVLTDGKGREHELVAKDFF